MARNWLRIWLNLLCGRTGRALRQRTTRSRHSERKPCLEILEPRIVLTGTANPQGFFPAQIAGAYGINQIQFGSVTGDGTGQTIAIIGVGDNPSLLSTTDPNYGTSDLAVFDQEFALPDPPSFQKVNIFGASTPLPPPTGTWPSEEALDVEWAHAIAPMANILLVEADEDQLSSQMVAVAYARTVPNVSVISMSFGWDGDYSDEQPYGDEQLFTTTPANHIGGITYVASTGDNGATGGYPEYPAYSPGVLAVGGTVLNVGGDNIYGGETGWSGSGGGMSPFEQPAYQRGIVTQSDTQRTIPDVAFTAGLGSEAETGGASEQLVGVAVYDTYSNGVGTGWSSVSGTSVSAPCWAGLIAIADQGRNLNGLPSLDGETQTLPLIYAMPSTDFNEITSGSNGTYSAGPGYNLVTGRGSPVAPLVVETLAGDTVDVYGVLTNEATGAAIPNTTISLFAEANGYPNYNQVLYSATTDANGHYSLVLPVDEVQIWINYASVGSVNNLLPILPPGDDIEQSPGEDEVNLSEYSGPQGISFITEPTAPPEPDANGILTIDGNADAANGGISVSCQGADIVVTYSDGNGDTWTAQYPYASVNFLKIDTQGGSYTLTVDDSSGEAIPAGGMSFDSGSAAGEDHMNFLGNLFEQAQYNGIGQTFGDVLMADGTYLEFSGLAPPPVFENPNPGPFTIDAGQTLAVDLSATDSDGGPLDYSLSADSPGFVQLQSGQYTWQPLADQVGTYTVTVTAQDQFRIIESTTMSFQVTVLPGGVNITSLSASPTTISNAGTDLLTLTASGVTSTPGVTLDPGLVGEVNFYRDAVGNGVFAPGTDFLLGTGTLNSNGSYSWSGYVGGLSPGTETFFAQAVGFGSSIFYSNVVSTTVTVTAAPAIPEVASPVGNQVQASLQAPADQVTSFLLTDSAGDQRLFWVQPNFSVPNQVSLDFYTQFDAVGTPASTPQFLVNYADGAFASAAMGPAGNFVVAWTSGSYSDLYAQWYSASGAMIGGIITISTNAFAQNPYVSLAVDNNGNALIAYDVGQYGSEDVYAATVTESGNITRAPWLVSSSTAGLEPNPTASLNSSGNGVIAWTDTNLQQITARQVSDAGLTDGPEFEVASEGAFVVSAINNSGTVEFAWTGSSGIYARQYGSNGQPLGPAFVANTFLGGSHSGPVIALNDAGVSVIAWTADGEKTSGLGSYAQVYDASGNAEGPEFALPNQVIDDQSVTFLELSSTDVLTAAWNDDSSGSNVVDMRQFNITIPPRFTGSYMFGVQASSPAGTVVGNVQAADLDGSQLVYSLGSGTPFAINASTGQITVQNAAALAYTQGVQRYVLTVEVSESGDPSAAASTTVIINVSLPPLEGPSAGSGSYVVAATGAWTATSNASWLHTSSGGTGNGLAAFTFDANTGATRIGTLTIAGQTLTVIQAGSTYVTANPIAMLVPFGLNDPAGVAVDALGNLYFADAADNAIKEYNAATQQITILVASGLKGPQGVAVDGAGNVYIADTGDSAVKEWNAATGQVTTLVATGLSQVYGVAVDAAGNVYIADTYDNAIKEWNATTQVVTTLVSGLNRPNGVAVDAAGNVYFADSANGAIKEWNAQTHQVSVLVSTGLNNPFGVAVDAAGNVYFADNNNWAIKEYSPVTEQVTTLATPTYPTGVAVDTAGNVYFTNEAGTLTELVKAYVSGTATSEPAAAGLDSLAVLPATQALTGIFAPSSNQSWLTIGTIFNGVVDFSLTGNAGPTPRTAQIDVLGQQITVTQAGTTLGTYDLLEGPAAGGAIDIVVGAWTATSNAPWLHTTSSGTANGLATFTFDANTGAARTGTITIAGQTLTVTQAGSGFVATNGFTTLVSAGLNTPFGVAVDAGGNVYIANFNDSAIEEWDAATQQTVTLAGPAQGVAYPDSVAVDAAGNIYFINSYGNNYVDEWNAATHQITTLVSSGLSNPGGLAVDAAGNLYIGDTGNNAVKEWIAATQQVVTLVASGLSGPEGVALDAAGNVYIADTGDNAIKEYNPATQQLTTLVSSGLNDPSGVAADGSGDVYIADHGDGMVKEWNARTQQTLTLPATGLGIPRGVAVDAAGSVYVTDPLNNSAEELVNAYVPTGPIDESAPAGSDSLAAVSPGTQSLTGVYAPASDQNWLTVGNVSNGVVNFSFTANTGISARTAHITLLGQQITVTQAARVAPTLTTTAGNTVAVGSGALLSASATLAGGVEPGGTITFTLTAPNGTVVDIEHIPVDGNGVYYTAGYLPAQSGTYEWTAQYGGDANNFPVVAPLSTTATSTLTGLYDIYDVAFDSSGNRYVAESLPSTVAIFAPGSTTPNGSISVFEPTQLLFNSSGDLFVLDGFGGNVSEFAPGGTTPIATLSGLDGPQRMAFDSSGNLYVTNDGGNSVTVYAPGTSAPFETLTGLDNPGAIAITSAGNVYVANNGNNTVSFFSPAFSTNPEATLTGLDGPNALTLDAGGDLYVANGGNGTVSIFTPGSLTPTGTITGLSGPTSLAIDAAGDLYVANHNSTTIEEFALGNTSMPIATFTGLAPYVLRFDPQGDLYDVNYGTATVSEFMPAAAAEKVLAQPIVVVTDSGGTYNGSPLPATASISPSDNNAGQTLEGVGLTLDYKQLGTGGSIIADLGSAAPTSVGSYQVTATFAGSTDYATASDQTTFTIDPAVSSSSANLPNNASILTISGASFDTNRANDSVTFDNGVTGTVAAATATSLTVSVTGLSSLATGTALHAGVTVDGVSSDTPVQVATVVNPTTTTVATSASSPVFGQAVTFTATVSGPGTPAGTVQFYDGSAALGQPVTLNSGVASLTTSSLSAGSHSIAAVYSGDDDDVASTGLLLVSSIVVATPGLSVSSPYGVALDAQGDMYIADTNNKRIVEVNAAGTASIVALPGLSLSYPNGVAVDGRGELFIADLYNFRIVELSAAGSASVVATPGLSLAYPEGVAVDAQGDLFIADEGNNRIVEVTAAGSASVIATPGLSLAQPYGVAVDAQGDLFIADSGNNRIVEVAAAGSASVLATPGLSLSYPEGVAVDAQGDLFIADTNNSRVVELTAAGSAGIVAPTGLALSYPEGVAVDAQGDLSIADSGNSRIVEVKTRLQVAPVVTASNANLAANAGSLTIAGAGFDSNKANDSVTFDNGVTGTVTAATAVSLTVSLSGLSSVPVGTALHASVSVDGAASVAPVEAANITGPIYIVTNTSNNSSTTGSLPWAVAQADSNTSGGVATIVFAAGIGQEFATPQTITLSGTALPVLTNAMTITGPSAGVTVSGAGLSRVFAIGDSTNNPNVSIANITVTQGDADGASFPASYGGGIFDISTGTLTLTDCTLTGNSAGEGGGLYNADGTAVLTSCTISDNSARQNGGGLANDYDSLTMINCTVEGNVAGASSFGGAGLFNYDGSATLTSCTVADNTATGSSGGGILTAQLTMNNTVVAGNTANGVESDIVGGPVTGDYDLTGDGSAPGTHSLTYANPLLTAPGDHGGLTQTMALLPGSPAIGAGETIAGISTDQRGDRLDSPDPDIGAFQSQGFTLTINSGDSPQSASFGNAFANPLAVTVTSQAGDPVAGGVVRFSAPGSGASASLSSTTAVIGSNGQADVTATANDVVGGAYLVSAAASGASSVEFTLTNTVQAQTISFTAPTSPITFVANEQVTLDAIGGASGDPVVFSIDGSSTGIGSINGDVLTVTGAGTLVIDANQAGNSDYSAAAQVQRTLVVNKVSQTITFIPPQSPITFVANEQVTLHATGGASGNPVVFSIDGSSTGTGSISGNVLTVTGAGAIVIDANEAGNSVYAPATQAQQSLAVIGAPTPISPAGGTVAAASGYDLPTFTWSSVPGASSYTFYIVDNTANQVLNGGIVDVNGTALTPTLALTPGHSYTWYAGASAGNPQFTVWNTGETFTLAGLAAPSLISPIGTVAASTGYDTPTFSWSAVAGANHYYLLVEDAATTKLVINDSTVSGTTFTPSASQALTPGHSYTWYVLAMSTNNEAYNYVTSGTTVTLAALPSPIPVAPTGTIAASTGYDEPTFTWSAAVGASTYTLYLIDNSAVPVAGTGTISSVGTAVSGTGTHFTSQILAGDLIGTAASGFYAVTAIASDTSLTLASAPASAFSGASFDVIANVLVDNANISGTSSTVTTHLTPGHNFTWYVGSVSNSGTTSWSMGQSFTLAGLAAPTPLGPIGTVAASSGFDTPTFSWSAVTGADHYYLYVVDNSNPTTPGLNVPDVSGTTFTPSTSQALTPGHSYTWYIYAASTNSQAYGYQAGGQTFSLAALSAPQLLSPASTIAASSGYDMPTFSWSASAGAGHYYLIVVDSTTGGIVINDANVSGTSFTPSTAQALTPGQGYTWYVLAMSTNSEAYNYLTSGQTFTLAELTAPTLIGPSGTIAASSGYDMPTFSWSASAGAGHYYLFVVDSTTGAVAINDPDVSGTTFIPSTAQALTPGHSYTWYVLAMSTNGEAYNYVTSGQTFTLAALAAPAPDRPTGTIAAAAGYDLPTFSWSSSTGAGHYYLYVVDDTTGMSAINEPNVGTATTFTPAANAALTPGHSYTWYVLAFSTNSQSFAYVNTGAMFTLAGLAAPALEGPSGSIASSTPTFSWSTVTGADHYYLYVVDDTTGGAVINQPDVNGTSFVPAAALTPDHEYTWYVLAMSTNDEAYDFLSAGQMFQVT